MGSSLIRGMLIQCLEQLQKTAKAREIPFLDACDQVKKQEKDDTLQRMAEFLPQFKHLVDSSGGLNKLDEAALAQPG